MVTSIETETANVDYLRYEEQASSSTPDSGFAIMYFKTDGLLYTKDDAGLETGPITNAAAIILNPASDVRNIIEPSSDFIPLTVRGSVAAQTKDIFVVEEGSADATVFSLSGTGAALFQNFTDSNAGFQIKDKDGGTAIFTVDTTNERVGLGAQPGDYRLHVNRVHTNTNAVTGINNVLWFTPSVPTTVNNAIRGLWAQVSKRGANADTGTGYLTALEAKADISGTGAIDEVRTINIQTILEDNTTAPLMTALHIETVLNNDAGDITLSHGLYIEDQTDATTSNAIVTNAGLIVFNEGGHAEADIRIETANEDHFMFIDTGANWLRVGDWDTNYTQFVVDGIQTMVGTARVKKILNLPVDGTGGGASKPTFTEAFAPFDGYLMSIGDDLHYEFEIPYDCDTSEDIHFVIHWYIDRAYADENAEVNWQIAYRSVTEDGTEPVDSGGSGDTVSSGDINIPGTNKSYLETNMTIVAANIELSDHLGVDFSRIALVGGTGPGGAKEPIVSQVHIEYTCNKLGQAL